MLRATLVYILTFISHCSYGQDVPATFTIGFAKGVVPTRTGQIGVNPVTDLGSEKYLNIGPNTHWYQIESSTTKWVGVNTEYLTDIPYTTTVNNQPSITTVRAAVVAATATAADNNLSPGDVSIAFSPKLLDVLNKLVAEAEAACQARRRRTSCNIDERFAQRVAEEARPGGVLDFLDAGIQATLPTVTASDVAAIMTNARVTGSLVAVVLVWKLFNKPQALTIGASSLSPGGAGDDKNEGCPANAPKGAEAPLCNDDNCKVNELLGNPTCSQGNYKGCQCLQTATLVSVVYDDLKTYDDGLSWPDLQQKLLQDLSDISNKSPFCLHSASPRGDRLPKEYCNCGEDPSKRTLTYSVASSTASPHNACPYTTNNGPTVTFSPASTPTPSSSVTLTCGQYQDKPFSSSNTFTFINQFCSQPYASLRLRPVPGTFSNAIVEYFNIEQDPMIQIYAYIDDGCKDKLSRRMIPADCTRALQSIMKECDTNTETNKMGGSAMINCQWYNMAAVKGPGRPGCPKCPT